MDQTILNKFIPQQILYFIAGRRCCQQFACTFRTVDHNILIETAHTLGLRSQYVLNNGQGCLKIYKRSCKHYLEEPKSLKLSRPTVVDILSLLTRTNIVLKEELPITDPICNYWSIKVPSLHVPLRAVSEPALRIKTEKYTEYLADTSRNMSLNDILKSIYSHRVSIFVGDLSLDKSILFPLMILDDAEAKKSKLNMFCIEKENIIASYNSDRFAEMLRENVGETVGIQVPQLSNISSATHIVYTTAKYFIRSLFSKDSKKFDKISHIVVNDVHLHDAYTDILLCELKLALNFNPNLRIILLLQHGSNKFLNYFDCGAVICIYEPSRLNLRISYLDDIQHCISLAGIHSGPEIYRNTLQLFRNKNLRNEQTDKCLQAYESLGNDAGIRPFLYSVVYELVPVNYQHSLTGKTAILIAAQLGNANHIRLLLYMGANPYILDATHVNAITVATRSGNVECINILNNFSLHDYVVKNAKPDFVDYDAIINIMYVLCTKPSFATGNVLIILPTYYHLVKLNYMLLTNFLTGHLRELTIFLLHDNMSMEYLDSLINTQTETIKVVLATDIIESLVLPIPFQHLIDTACQKKVLHDSSSNSPEDRYDWVAKDCLMRRQLLLEPSAIGDSHCFRLLTQEAFNTLNNVSRPELQSMPLDKICLTVKLLAPNMVVSEYLTYAIAPPPIINIHQTMQFLKKIDVLDEAEDVTNLGLRLIDIPVSCQLGRTIIFGILLQCLDPILTIVSSLTMADPLSIPFNDDIDCIWDKFTVYIQNRIKSERSRLAGDQFSDHLIFVRLFQEWQNRLKQNVPPLHLTDEYEFVLNGLMEQLNSTRIQIVSALRVANLIHSQGPLSMQSVNLKSNNWPLVKAALTGGMYPSLCAVDHKKKCINSAHSANVHLHPNTVLREFLEPFNIASQRICTEWIVCSKLKNSIQYATVVSPLAVAMFAGSSKLGLGQITEIPTKVSTDIHFFIDEWVWLEVSKSDFELVLKVRQFFFQIYQYVLKHCSDTDKWRSDTTNITQHHLLFETLDKLFENEDTASGFKACPHIGFRPTLKLPNLFLLRVNSHFIWNQPVDDKTALVQREPILPIERQFFLLYTEYSSGDFFQKTDAAYIERVLGKFARPIETPSRHIYAILYSKNPDLMLSISRAKIHKGEFTLKEYFRNTIPIYEIMQVCASLNMAAPNFDGRLIASLIDKRVGGLIMDLFAYRHHWIH